MFLIRRSLLVLLFVASNGCASERDVARQDGAIRIDFNTAFIEHIHNDHVDLDNYREVLKLVLSMAGDPIKVYPSEGYFYFSFFSNGDLIKGNLRFDRYLREDGYVSFAYFRQFSDSKRRAVDRNNHWTLGPDDGFFLTQIDPFHFDLEYENVSAVVEIYDAKRELSAVKPINEGEIYVGPVLDESGVRFHLIFDQHSNVFLFVLNETLGATETFRHHKENSNILIGNRTQFAFYQDGMRHRRILIGVNRANVIQNTLYDGPFDQLPDSFVDPVQLMNLILLYKPSLNGRIGPGGIFLSNQDMRVGLYPYMDYAYERQLLDVSQCEESSELPHRFNRCLASLRAEKGNP